MRNCVRNQIKLFPDSDSFGIILKKFKNYKFCSNSLLDPQSISPRKAQFCLLVPGNSRSSHSPFVMFLDQFISTFSAGNHSVKFQYFRISTEKSPCKLF